MIICFFKLSRITRIFTKLGVHKSLYFLLSHEFSPDGELFCEYIMLQRCKSMFCYIELTLIMILNSTLKPICILSHLFFQDHNLQKGFLQSLFVLLEH